jgi:polar amino acid transport system ATP-binding protein
LSIVQIEGVHKSFGNLHVLKNINFNVEKGEDVMLIGRSGSGKSTLLRCINGLEPIQKGNIWVDGDHVNGKKTNLKLLRQKVGIVFQSFNLFPHLTVERNITLAPMVAKKLSREEATDIAQHVLHQVGLEDKIKAYPDELSGGQQQRVAIARSLAMQPKLMLFDEITSALDPELIGEVLKVLESLAEQGMTMILVSHEMGFARKVADRVVFIYEGEIWETGPADQMFDKPQTPELQVFINSIL